MIPLPVIDGIEFIDVEEITHCEAKGSYCIISTFSGKKITITKNLKDFESSISKNNFLRVHNSWVINIKYLKKYYRSKNSYIEMKDGSTINVSSRKKEDVLRSLGIKNL